LENEISDRIWVTRYLMVIGIVVLHLPPYQPLSEVGGSLFSYVKAFFSYGVFRAAVPVLTVMSGYLIFKTGLQYDTRKLLLTKVKSILVPLILWDIPPAAAVFVIQKYGLISHSFSAELYPVTLMSWINALTGLSAAPINYPLNFLRDLFVISALTPVVWLILKRMPYIGLVVISIVYYFNLDGQLILRNSMLVSFYIGALAAHRNWNVCALDEYAIPLLCLFILFSASIVLFKIENRELFRFVSPFLVWPAMSLVTNLKLGTVLLKNSRNSFFTFLAHGPIILVLWLLFSSLPMNIPYYVYWLTAPILTVVFCAWLCRVFGKKMPLLASVMLGNR
jgi:succinoglycan biosynthesis protein ExoH